MHKRFVGVKNGHIKIISNKSFIRDDLQSYPVPEDIDCSNEELMLNYRIKNDCLVRHKGSKPANELKLALVGNFRMSCGISVYNEFLWPEITKRIGDYKLFIEHNDLPTGDIHYLGDQHIEKVSSCWKRGKPLSILVKEIKDYDPDIVLVSHEWGLFPNARHWLSFMSQLSDYRIIVILHSVFPTHIDKTICEASIPEIVIHQIEAKNALQDMKGIMSPITIIPHGCYPAVNTDPLWNLYDSKHTFTQQGFGFSYKRFEHCLQATALLKNKYPDVFFTALFSESRQNKMAHQMYFDKLLILTQTLGIEDNVAIVRGYQSDATIDAYLRTNSVAVFPYVNQPEHIVCGSSGAARLAMSKGVPVISSSINHFKDLPTIKAETPQEIADALDNLFSNPQVKNDQIQKQLSFIENNSWENVAKMFVELFEKKP